MIMQVKELLVNTFKVFIILLISCKAFSQDFKVVKKDFSKTRNNEISYSYKWEKAKKLSAQEKEILDIAETETHLEVLKAKFQFSINGDSSTYNKDFFSDVENLEKLAGMSFEQIGDSLYKVNDSVMGVKVRAISRSMFDLEYNLYDDAFNYQVNNSQPYLLQQRTNNFNDALRSADIITHIHQDKSRTIFTINSYALLTEEESDSFLVWATKKMMVSQMKTQIIKSAQFYRSSQNKRSN